MAHQLSVTEIKQNSRHPNSRNVPREGTALRSFYDKLFSSPGCWQRFNNHSKFGPRPIVDLKNYYGLDIRRRRIPDGYGTGEFELMLAGEWFGRVYLDYVADPASAVRGRE